MKKMTDDQKAVYEEIQSFTLQTQSKALNQVMKKDD